MNMNKVKVDNIIVSENRVEVRFSTEGEIAKYFHEEHVFWCEYSIPVKGVQESVAVIPFVSNILPIIWLSDATLELPSLDARFYHCIEDIKDGYRNMYPGLSFRGRIICDNICEYRECGSSMSSDNNSESAMLFSGGVGAFSTLLSCCSEKPILITVRGADIKLGDTNGWEIVRNHTMKTAMLFNSSYATISTNFKMFIDYVELDNWLINASGDNYWHGFQHGIGLIGLTAPLSGVLGFNKLYIASTFNNEQLGQFTCASDPRIDNCVKFTNLDVVHDGCAYSRQEKVDRIVSYAQQTGRYPVIRVCWMHDGGVNCCRCEKCLRTIFEIYAAGGVPEDYGFGMSENELRHSRRNMIIYGFSQDLRKKYWDSIQSLFRKKRPVVLPKELEWIYSTDLKHPYRYPDVFLFNMARETNRWVLKTYWGLRNRLR